jgi:hypothetical protein
MQRLILACALLAGMFQARTTEAGIFGRRWTQPANQTRWYPQQGQPARQPASEYRSNSQQPTFPFSSRSDPREWKEAHRGYGIKLRGW